VWRERVTDIVENIAHIEEMTAGANREDFESGSLTARAVHRSLGIISEAARYVPPEVQARHPDIPWREMRGVAGVLPMPYMGADLGIVWEGIRKDLPPLGHQLRALLEHTEKDDRFGRFGGGR
jgi:uncharacterized protein with HEPN domain